MRIDIDSYKEILDTITRNKSRSLLTGFGVFWGVFMLVVLIGGGQGVKELLANNFEGFATNTTMVFVQPTTKAYKGFRKGRSWNAEDRDVARIRERMPELEVVTPMVFGGQATVVYGDRKSSGNIKGLLPEYQKVQAPKIYYGRFINEMDVKASRRVCVLGKKIAKELFGDIDPCGKRVKVGNIYYQIVGVDYNNSGINMGGQAEEAITIPFNVCRQIYNFGKYVHTIAMVGRGDVNMKSLEPRIREIIAREHSVDPTDEHAISLFNTQVMFGIMDSLFKGVNFLIWLIGLGTILAGAIGVSNIMMVTVKERTTEIGIRRAIGATPKMILSQIMSESLILTTVAGMSGILFGVSILQMIELANTEDGILKAHFQIGFWTALAAAALLSVLGMVAGLAPAYRAMAIKPVDAMRDE
ncbi:MAG: ABC transporter permease [Prevotellaceae bacterium]|nr:ABC transporter permease [Prevotellaceae bacterium]